MVLARGHGLLAKQAYPSAISSLQSTKFHCYLLVCENIDWSTAANWINVGYIVVVNKYLSEPGVLSKKHLVLGVSAITNLHTSKEMSHAIV